MRTEDNNDDVARKVASQVREQLGLVGDGGDLMESDHLKILRSSGLLGLPAHEMSIRTMSGIARALATSSRSTALIWSMHAQQVRFLRDHLPRRLRESTLSAITTGKEYVASVTTEQDTGSSLRRGSSAGSVSRGHLRLDRLAPVVTGGAHADSYLIKVQNPYTDLEQDTVFIYARRADIDVQVLDEWPMMGMRGVGNVRIHLRGSVPSEAILLSTGAARAKAQFAAFAHVAWSSIWLGCAQAAMTEAVSVLRPRRRSILASTFSLVRLGELQEKLEATQALLNSCIERVESRWADLTSFGDQRALNSLKTFSARECFNVVDGLIDLVGLADGYRTDSSSGLERAFRDLRSARLLYSDEKLFRANGALTLLNAHDERSE